MARWQVQPFTLLNYRFLFHFQRQIWLSYLFQLWPERSVNFDAQFIDFVQNNEFLVSGGSNRTVSVYTLEGVYIGDLCSQQDAWIRTAKSHPFLNQLAVGTQTGQLIVLEVEQNFLKSRHRTRFVYRENMTDVVVQHLLSNEKVRIKCHSLVSALALYHQRLAVSVLIATRTTKN